MTYKFTTTPRAMKYIKELESKIDGYQIQTNSMIASHRITQAKVQELEAYYNAIILERDELRSRVQELEAALSSIKVFTSLPLIKDVAESVLEKK
jgi:hypothetical protein